MLVGFESLAACGSHSAFESWCFAVLENVKKDFEQEGVDGSILSDLQIRWEKKLMSSGALSLEPIGSQKEVREGCIGLGSGIWLLVLFWGSSHVFLGVWKYIIRSWTLCELAMIELWTEYG